jgi:predicted GIY-YIG superfamily endonuclease
MIKELDLSALDFSAIQASVLSQIKSMTYTELEYKQNGQKITNSDLKNIVTSSSLSIFDSAIKTEDKYCYVYVLAHNNKVLYVGRAADIKGRLKSHLIYRSKKTKSKIENVYNLIISNGDIKMQCWALKIEGNRTYSMIEGILIDHYNTINIGWNDNNS